VIDGSCTFLSYPVFSCGTVMETGVFEWQAAGQTCSSIP